MTEDYHYSNAQASHTHAYLWSPVIEILETHGEKRVFDLGCGNGAFARTLASKGYEVTGVDPSEEGIAHAKSASQEISFEVGNAYEPLAQRFGTFPAVVSLEVVEHVYAPRKFSSCVHDLLVPGGIAIISTPYHSYLKNLALAATGKMESHFTALWDHGHIKFWRIQVASAQDEQRGGKWTHAAVRRLR